VTRNSHSVRRFQGIAFVLLLLLFQRFGHSRGEDAVDPGRGGDDHVGRPLPEYTTGDECLFCHRDDVAAKWPENSHGRTIQFVDRESPPLKALLSAPELAQPAAEIDYVLGGLRRQRFLKTGPVHGQLELWSVAWGSESKSNRPRLLDSAAPSWDAKAFGQRCAGCHATAVDAGTQRFSVASLDCYVCHGVIPAEHTGKPELALFAPARAMDPRVEISICGQCHLRGGRSRSSGLPYANNFVPGDNLFRDFRIELTDESIAAQEPGDAHVLANVRDVVLRGRDSVTCLTCHDVHSQSSKRHRTQPESGLCWHCHDASGPRQDLRPLSAHNETCEY